MSLTATPVLGIYSRSHDPQSSSSLHVFVSPSTSVKCTVEHPSLIWGSNSGNSHSPLVIWKAIKNPFPTHFLHLQGRDVDAAGSMNNVCCHWIFQPKFYYDFFSLCVQGIVLKQTWGVHSKHGAHSRHKIAVITSGGGKGHREIIALGLATMLGLLYIQNFN